jgi:hypothetical protein
MRRLNNTAVTTNAELTNTLAGSNDKYNQLIKNKPLTATKPNSHFAACQS